MRVSVKFEFFHRAAMLMGLASSIFFIATIFVALENTHFYKIAKPTVGHIVGYKTSLSTGGRGVLKFPIVTYKDQFGLSHKGVSNIAMKYSKKYKLGESYKVMYLPNNPDVLKADNVIGIWGHLIVFIGMSFMSIILYLIFDYYTIITPKYILI